ncbi:hypothetical protein B0H16DRAFT_1312522 [Mycena metata]|uniref:Protein kinase domain-containing protein n=1 Tax=Mycena metata TaxID=1033252 RepID=A0AAD7JBF0_9AGAR|nr:hypothetical protein B0H16DRAFT_1312522 [Mycena metata]
MEEICPATPPEASGVLEPKEIVWRDLQPWLQQSGYTLRPRFRRSWIPSWKVPGSSARLLVAEDSWGLIRDQILDAVRDRDGFQVVLKQVSKADHPSEETIHRFLSAPGSEMSQDPTNHCIPLLDVLHPPNDSDLQILVMQLLRKCNSPPFDTFGEVIDFFNQIFEGLQFMHKHLVAHGDCSSNNIMMTCRGMYPDGFHPQYQNSSRDLSSDARHLTRTQRPPRYYFIDFGISVRFNAEDPCLALPIKGADQTVPEHQIDGDVDPQDPFATDIYYLGNSSAKNFWTYKISPGCVEFEFMRPLVTNMVNVDLAKRPTIDEVILRFEKTKSGLSSWKLPSRVRIKDEIQILNIPRILGHWKRRIRYIVDGNPPIPVYRA